MLEAYWLTQRESVQAFRLQLHLSCYYATSTYILVLLSIISKSIRTSKFIIILKPSKCSIFFFLKCLDGSADGLCSNMQKKKVPESDNEMQ